MDKAEKKAARIRDLVARAVGQRCWSAMWGERMDASIVLELGEKLRRAVRLANPRLSFLQRTYEGEYRFLIECAWRLDGPDGVIGASTGVSEPGGSLDAALAQLSNQILNDVEVISDGCDLTIHFSGGFDLRCLSTETRVGAKRNNWSFWSPSGLLSILPRGTVFEQDSLQAERAFEDFKLSLAPESEIQITKPIKPITKQSTKRTRPRLPPPGSSRGKNGRGKNGRG